MIKNRLPIILVLVCSMWSVALPQEKAPAEEPPLLTFGYLQKGPDIKGQFRISGYVIETHECPPCPPRAQCKPCLGDYIVITDNVDEKDPKLIRRLRIFTDKPNRFELKKRFTFTVTVKGKIEEGHAIKDANLVSFEDYMKIN